jgi:hypothetical protein
MDVQIRQIRKAQSVRASSPEGGADLIVPSFGLTTRRQWRSLEFLSAFCFLKCVDFGALIRQSNVVMMNLSRMAVCKACCCNCCVRLSSAPGAS